MMKFLVRFADNTNAASLASKLRRRRFKLFHDLLSKVHGNSVSILDVGGTESFWNQMGPIDKNVAITLINPERIETTGRNIKSIIGDGRVMPQFNDREFDIVFSNSAIEHVGSYEDQLNMAREIRRVGKRYFVQTPNYYFPLEPHFLFPFFQWLPLSLRAFLAQHFSLGWFERMNDPAKARALVSSVRLMTRSEIASAFPDAVIWKERFWGITKSFVAYKG
jgi:hypothetical protein